MSTELQRQKLEQQFDRFDSNGDGVIDQSDVDRLVQGWCAAFGATPGSEQWQKVTTRSNKLWRLLDGHLDADGDMVVDKEQWVAAHGKPDFIDKVAIPLAQATFELGDVSQDGRLGLNEWMTAQSIAGVGQMEALEVFQSLDEDGDGFVTAAEHLAALREFYGSTDRDSVGNHLAGRL
ncbi:EF-hand domain-containing protein [Saccharothrix isguenensis]